MYLQLAILATSIRYSSKACWRDCKEEAIDKYACLSWDIISASGLALVDEPDISVVQAIALLSIIDTIGELSDMNTCQNGMGLTKILYSRPKTSFLGQSWNGNPNQSRSRLDARYRPEHPRKRARGKTTSFLVFISSRKNNLLLFRASIGDHRL